MSGEEMSNLMDVLYNNITSNQAPGLTEYEKSLFLTKGQDEVLKNYFNPKGNKYQEGFDGSQKRQMDFSVLMKSASPTVTAGAGNFDARTSGVGKVTIPSDVWLIINEKVTVTRGTVAGTLLTVKPISFDEYDRVMSKPFKRPLKHQAWRLITAESKSTDLIAGPGDTITGYSLRYIRRPKPVIIGNLDGLTIDGYYFTGSTAITGATATSGCELDPILHEEIVQRAVELAKIAWTSTGQDNTEAVLQAGQRSE